MPSSPLKSKATYYSRKLMSGAKKDFRSLPEGVSEQQVVFRACNSRLPHSDHCGELSNADSSPRFVSLLSRYYVPIRC